MAFLAPLIGALPEIGSALGAVGEVAGAATSAVSGVSSLVSTVSDAFGGHHERSVPNVDHEVLDDLTEIDGKVLKMTTDLHKIARDNHRREMVTMEFDEKILAHLKENKDFIKQKFDEVKVNFAHVEETLGVLQTDIQKIRDDLRETIHENTLAQLGAGLSQKLKSMQNYVKTVEDSKELIDRGTDDIMNAWTCAEKLDGLIGDCIPSAGAPGGSNYWTEYARSVMSRYKALQKDGEDGYTNVLSDSGSELWHDLQLESKFFRYYVSALHSAIRVLLSLAIVNQGNLQVESSKEDNASRRKLIYVFAQKHLLNMVKFLHMKNPKRSWQYREVCRRLLMQRIVVTFEGTGVSKEFFLPLNFQVRDLDTMIREYQKEQRVTDKIEEVTDFSKLLEAPDQRIQSVVDGDTIRYKLPTAKHDEVAKHKVAVDTGGIRMRRTKSLGSDEVGILNEGVEVRVIKTSKVRALIDPGPCWVSLELDDGTELLKLAETR